MIKKLLFKTTHENSFINEGGITLLRFAAGILMAGLHGSGKIPPSEQLIGGVTGLGFPAPALFAWLAGLAELLGGIYLAVGFMTRPSAFFIAVTMFVASISIAVISSIVIPPFARVLFRISSLDVPEE